MSPHEDPQLEVRAREVGNPMKKVCENWSLRTGRSIGFLFMLYDHGEGGFLSYMSNSERSDVVKMLEEFIGKVKAGEV